MASPSAPQGRKLIKVTPRNLIEQNVYEEKPQAKRICIVDECGEKIGAVTDSEGIRRLAVDAEVSLNVDNIVVDISNPTTPRIINHTVVTANTEFSIALPDKTKVYTVSSRESNAKIRLAFESGKTATEYITIKYGNTWNSGDVDLPDGTIIYLQSTKAGVVIEVQPWLLL